MQNQEQIIHTKSCVACGATFHITDKDLEFYGKVSPVFGGKKYSIPAPTHCSDCRQQRRLAWRNERKLYKRTCDATGKSIISVYSDDKPYKVYEQKEWRSDKWDPMQYGFAFDPNKGFFLQFDELLICVPRIALNGHLSNENAEYVNFVVHSKNMYMCFGGGYNENVFYSALPMYTTNCVEVLFSMKCNMCYDIAYSTNCYKVYYGFHCADCSDCYHVEHCAGCSYCFGCSGLQNKKYNIYNREVTEKEYLDFMQQYSHSQKVIDMEARSFLTHTKVPYLNIAESQNCLGNNITNSKNCLLSSNIHQGDDVRYCHRALYSSDAMDSTQIGVQSTLLYEIMTSSVNIHKCAFSAIIRENCSQLYYCSDISNCQHCFGCVGLRNKSYCILNKQYTKEEYEVLVPQIIEKMQADGEWGEFFPISMSPFAYNETVAQEYFSMTKEQVLAKNLQRKEDEDRHFNGPWYKPLAIDQYDLTPTLSSEEMATREKNRDVTK